jgi:hypothetical protein
VIAICQEVLGERLRGPQAAKARRASEIGLNWLATNYTLATNPGTDQGWFFYYIYGIERVGTLYKLERFGEHEWYREGAELLIKKQEKDGPWDCTKAFSIGHWLSSIEESDTCFAILFLKRASRPTVSTRSIYSEAEVEVPRTGDVWLRTDGSTDVVLWIAGFDDTVLAKHGGGALGGLRVARVEYLSGSCCGTASSNPANTRCARVCT